MHMLLKLQFCQLLAKEFKQFILGTFRSETYVRPWFLYELIAKGYSTVKGSRESLTVSGVFRI